MTDYGYIFSMALQKKLKERIRAGIFVKESYDDRIEVTIVRKSEDLTFKMSIDNFASKIVHGYSSEYAAYEVLSKYKRFILNRYFIKEEDSAQ